MHRTPPRQKSVKPQMLSAVLRSGNPGLKRSHCPLWLSSAMRKIGNWSGSQTPKTSCFGIPQIHVACHPDKGHSTPAGECNPAGLSRRPSGLPKTQPPFIGLECCKPSDSLFLVQSTQLPPAPKSPSALHPHWPRHWHCPFPKLLAATAV